MAITVSRGGASNTAKGSRAGTLVVAVLVLALAAQLAHWTWVFLAPAPLASSRTDDGPADLAVAARLFGGSTGGNPVAAKLVALRLGAESTGIWNE